MYLIRNKDTPKSNVCTALHAYHADIYIHTLTNIHKHITYAPFSAIVKKTSNWGGKFAPL